MQNMRNIYIAIAVLVLIYDVKSGWERSIAEAERLIADGGGAPASTNAWATALLA